MSVLGSDSLVSFFFIYVVICREYAVRFKDFRSGLVDAGEDCFTDASRDLVEVGGKDN